MAALLTVETGDNVHSMVSRTATSMPDEAALVARAQRGNARAFEALYRAHVDRVYGLCLRMTGNVGEAEDCTQEAFIQAWNKLSRFRGDSSFGTWLHRVAVNVDRPPEPVTCPSIRSYNQLIGRHDGIERRRWICRRPRGPRGATSS